MAHTELIATGPNGVCLYGTDDGLLLVRCSQGHTMGGGRPDVIATIWRTMSDGEFKPVGPADWRVTCHTCASCICGPVDIHAADCPALKGREP